MELNKIQEDVDQAKIISFDCFDTLLLRPYSRPTDLFLHIEKDERTDDFCKARIKAEREARKKSPNEEITFEEIYTEIDDEFKSLAQIELAWEEMVCIANPEMKKIRDYAKKRGKKIIVISDMYLPANFVAKLLRKIGFADYEKLYVSSELKKTKATGTLFKQMLTDFGVPAKEILHIGDNKSSDYKIPQKLGIRAVKYEKILDQFLKQSPRSRDFLKYHGNGLGASILLAIFAIRWRENLLHGNAIAEENYFRNLGYEYAGPVAYGFTHWIEKIASEKQIDSLLFVARDGYTLQKVFETFSTIKNHYIYASRFIRSTIQIDFEKFSEELLDYFREKYPEIREKSRNLDLKNSQEFHNFVCGNEKLFKKYSELEREEYLNYLRTKIGDGNAKIGIVDTRTEGFSAQKLLEKTLKKPLFGFYWVAGIPKNLYFALDFSQYASDFLGNETDELLSLTKNWDFMEFILTAPELPIKGLKNGLPVYPQNPDPAEIKRKEIYPEISAGALEFARYVSRFFAGKNIFLEAQEIVNWINAFFENPTKSDLLNMSLIKHAYSSEHQKYEPLFCDISIPFWKRKKLRKLFWRTKSQNIAFNLMSLLEIKSDGFAQICINFFPKMKTQFLCFRLKFGKSLGCEIIIGNRKSSGNAKI